MNVADMFQPDLMRFDMTAESELELFQEIGKKLEALGYVTKDYIQGLIEREGAFPTGLITRYLNIALPHGDSENVIHPFVYIARVDHGIKVKQMGDGQEMLTEDFLFLGIADSTKQVGLLSALMELFMMEDFVEAYKESSNGEQVKQLLDVYLKEGVKKNG